MELFSFEGRMRRRDYWLISFGIGLALGLAAAIAEAAPVLYLLIWIPLFWIELATGAKRCHDLGHNGWWQIIPFYPVWMAFQDGEPGTNEYGPNPKAPRTTQKGASAATKTSASTSVVPQSPVQHPQPTTQNSVPSSPWGNGPVKTTSTTQNVQKAASDNLSDSISSKWK